MPWKTIKEGIAISQIAEICGGKVIGNQNQEVFGICTLDQPKKSYLAYCSSPRSIEVKRVLDDPKIMTLITSIDIKIEDIPKDKTIILVDEPQKSLLKLLPSFFESYEKQKGISEKASIHPTTKLGENVSIGDFCSIAKSCTIGDNVIIHPNVVLYPGVTIGKNSIIHSGVTVREDCILDGNSVIQNGAIIGSDGFGYILNEKNNLTAVPQIGNVHLSESVDVGANACIDRATLGSTTIGQGSKVDNQAQIGHNARIGKSSIICGQVGIAGSANIGNGVVLGGKAGVADHVKVGDGVRIGANSSAYGDITIPGDYLGYPAQKASAWRRQSVMIRKLEKLYEQVKILSKKVQDK